MISKDTADWLRSLPHPDDEKAWNERMTSMLFDALVGVASPEPPLPWDDDEESA